MILVYVSATKLQLPNNYNPKKKNKNCIHPYTKGNWNGPATHCVRASYENQFLFIFIINPPRPPFSPKSHYICMSLSTLSVSRSSVAKSCINSKHHRDHSSFTRNSQADVCVQVRMPDLAYLSHAVRTSIRTLCPLLGDGFKTSRPKYTRMTMSEWIDRNTLTQNTRKHPIQILMYILLSLYQCTVYRPHSVAQSKAFIRETKNCIKIHLTQYWSMNDDKNQKKKN